MRSPSHNLAQNAFFLLGGQAASSALSLILTAFLGRWLGVVEFGIYYLLVALSTFAYVLVDWGQSAYLIRELQARRREDGGKLLGGALAFRAAVIIVAALAIAVLVRALGYDSRTELLAFIAVVCGLPLALLQAYGYMFRGRDRMDLDAAVTVTGKALTVAVTVLAVVLGGGLPAAVSLQSIGSAGALLVAVLLARKIGIKAQNPGRGILQELARGGAPIAVFFVAMAVQPIVDVIVLSKLAPPEVVGWYGAARNIMVVIFAPATILGAASFPELSRVSGSVPDLRRALRTNFRLLVGLGALAAAGTFLFADVAVGLIYGRGHFDPAVAVLQVFAPVLPLLFVDILFGNAIIALGKTKEIAVVKALAVTISTGLAILLIPICQVRFGNGGIGLALAFGSTEVLMLIAFLWLLPRGVVDLSAFLDSIRAAAGAVGTMAILWALPSMTPWLALPACVAVFLPLTLATGLVRRADLDKVADLRRHFNLLKLASIDGNRGTRTAVLAGRAEGAPGSVPTGPRGAPLQTRGSLMENLKLIHCTRDGGQLSLIFPTSSKQIRDGEVRCGLCKQIYHVREGILDMLGTDVPADRDSRQEMELHEGKHQQVPGAPGSKLSWRDVAEIESTIKRIGNPSGKIVLELGCGPGAYTRRLMSAKRLLAIDFSLTALRRNQAQLPKEAPVGLVRADVGRLLLAPGAFDVALTTLYSNLPTPALRRACNQAVAAALRPAGRYIVSTHHQDHRRVLKGLSESGYYSEGGIFFQCFTDQTLRAELNAFEIEAIGPVCVEIPLISRLPSDRLRAWVAQHAAWLPAVNRFGSTILLASVRKPVH